MFLGLMNSNLCFLSCIIIQKSWYMVMNLLACYFHSVVIVSTLFGSLAYCIVMWVGWSLDWRILGTLKPFTLIETQIMWILDILSVQSFYHSYFCTTSKYFFFNFTFRWLWNFTVIFVEFLTFTQQLDTFCSATHHVWCLIITPNDTFFSCIHTSIN